MSEIFDAKCLSVFFKVVLSYILLYVAAIIVFYLCLAKNLNSYVLVDSAGELLPCMISDFLVMEQLLLVCALEILSCSIFSTSMSIAIGIVASLAPLIIGYIPVLKYINIEKVLDMYNSDQISAMYAFVFGCAYALIIMIPVECARKKLKRVDVC